MASAPKIQVTLETLQTIVDALPMPMFLIDRHHRLVLVNDAMCAMTGHPRERLLNRSDYPMPEEQMKVLWPIDDEVFATGQPNENEEVATVGDNAKVLFQRADEALYAVKHSGKRGFLSYDGGAETARSDEQNLADS